MHIKNEPVIIKLGRFIQPRILTIQALNIWMVLFLPVWLFTFLFQPTMVQSTHCCDSNINLLLFLTWKSSKLSIWELRYKYYWNNIYKNENEAENTMEILTVEPKKKRQPIKEISFRFSSVLIVAIIAVTFTVTSTYVQYAKPLSISTSSSS